MIVSVPSRSVSAHGLVILALAAVVACKEPAEPPRATSIVGMQGVDSVRLGRTFTFDHFELRGADGQKVTGRRVSWSSLNPQIASVDENGTVTGVALGNTVITARADDATASSTIFVQEPVASVVLFPADVSIPVGSTQQLTVAVSDRNGIALAGRTVTFSSSNVTVATVNSSGVVVAVAQGQATISGEAILDHVTGTSRVTVTQVPVASVTISPAGSQTVFQGSALQLTATLRDAGNNVLGGRPINWTTSNPSVATVSGSGLVTGIGLGTTQITAESEGRTGSVSVTVSPTPVATVSINPNPGSVRVGSALQMSLDLRDGSGNPLTTVGRTIIWDSTNRPVATVQDGVVTGISVGSATITVNVDGKSASAAVTVTPP